MDVGYIARQLRAAGANAEITGAGLLLNGTPARLEMMGNRPATPSDLRRIAEACRVRVDSDAHARPVISAERASPLAISWLQTHPEVALILEDRVVLDGVVHWFDEAAPAAHRRKGPQPFARFATARVLLSGASRKDQVSLARLAGVTQGSVSNALRRLPEVQDPGTTFDDLVRDYPGPGGQTYYWWSSRPVHEQMRDLAEHGALLSGDFAADSIAPWRMPERVVAYMDAPVDLAASGYVLAEPNDYTTLVVVPADQTIKVTAATWGVDDDNVADPIVTAYDVLRTATTGDEGEAVKRLRDVVVKRFSKALHG